MAGINQQKNKIMKHETLCYCAGCNGIYNSDVQRPHAKFKSLEVNNLLCDLHLPMRQNPNGFYLNCPVCTTDAHFESEIPDEEVYRLDDKKFLCTWFKSTYGKDIISIETEAAFTENAGYDYTEIKSIHKLAIGDTYKCSDHLITRVAADFTCNIISSSMVKG